VHVKRFALALTITTVLVGGIFFSTAYLASYTDLVPDSLNAGHEAFKARDFHQALAHYRKAVTENPENAVAQAWLGYMARAFGQAEEGLGAYEKSAALDPSFGSLYMLGEFAGYIGETEMAIQALQKGLSLASQRKDTKSKGASSKIAQTLFQVLFEASDRDGALSFARSQGWINEGVDFCKPDPKRAVPYQIAGLLALLVHPTRAECALEVAEDITDTGHYRLPRMIVNDLMRHSEREETKQKAEAFGRHRLPSHVIDKRTESLNAMGTSLYMRYRLPDHSLELFKEAIAADPKFAQPYYRIGYIHWEKHHHDEAISWLRQALSVQPDHWRSVYILGCVFSSLKRDDDALIQYRRAAELNPDDDGSFYLIGTILSKREKFDEALPNFEKAVALNPISAYNRWYLSWVLKKLGRERESERQWDFALKLDPNIAQKRGSEPTTD
jgi:tetratricopeptide (TPR) repeat protein